jgi:hypothetical protein
MRDELLKQKTWLKGKNLLPFVYSINGKITIAEELIDVCPINAIRGLMITSKIELEIACSRCDFLTAKSKAIEARAELLCCREAELYKNAYQLFCKTVIWLEEKGFELDEFSRYALFTAIDGEWCEEVWHQPEGKRKAFNVLHDVVSKCEKLAACVTDNHCGCRLLHRHEI